MENRRSIYDKWLFVLMVCFSLFDHVLMGNVLFGGQGTGVIASLVVLVLIILVWMLRSGFKLRLSLHPCGVWALAFGFYCLLSCVWALDRELAFLTVRRLLVEVVAVYIYVQIFLREESIEPLLKAYVLAGAIFSVYAISIIGLGDLQNLLRTATRISNSLFNGNLLGIYLAPPLLFSVYLLLYRKSVFWGALMLPMIPPIIVSTSRTAFVGIALGIVGLVFFKATEDHRWASKFAKGMLCFVAMIVAFVFVYNLPVFSGLRDRMDGLIRGLLGKSGADGSTLERSELARIGVQIFRQYPITGVGIGNPSVIVGKVHRIINHATYLHNNYSEVLAGGGLLGLILYYWIYAYFAVGFVKYWNYRDSEYKLCLILFGVFLITDFGNVSYMDRYRYLCISILYLQAHNIRRRARQSGLAHDRAPQYQHSMYTVGVDMKGSVD